MDPLDIAEDRLPGFDAAFATGLRTHYVAPADALTTAPADLRVSTGLDPARQEQVSTLLRALGYLTDADKTTPAVIERAFARWRDEQQLDDGIRWEIGDRNSPAEDENLAGLEAGERARRRLKAAATLEGEVVLARLPLANESTLLSRIAAFRLGLFIDRPVLAGAASFPPGFGAALSGIARLLGFADSNEDQLTVLNLLGHIDELTVRLQSRCDQIVVALPQEDPKGHRTGLTWRKYAIAQGTSAMRGIGKSPTPTQLQHPGRLQYVWLGGTPADSALNAFAINFLQVRLWMLGYYEESIDRDWGPVSWAALREFGAAYQLEWESYRAAVVAPADRDGQCALDFGYFLTAFADLIDNPARRLSANDLKAQVDAVFSDAETQDPHHPLWARLGEASVAEQGLTAVRAIAPAAHSPRYFGWRGIFSAIGGFFHDLFAGAVATVKKLVAKVVEALQRSLALARQVVRFLADSTRLAVRIGKLALQRFLCWLSGTPVVTEENGVGCATFAQRDFDTLAYVSAACPAELQARHAQTLEWMDASFAFFLAVGLELVKLIEIVGVAWWLFAWKVLAAIRAMVQDWQEFAERAGMAGFFGASNVA